MRMGDDHVVGADDLLGYVCILLGRKRLPKGRIQLGTGSLNVVGSSRLQIAHQGRYVGGVDLPPLDQDHELFHAVIVIQKLVGQLVTADVAALDRMVQCAALGRDVRGHLLQQIPKDRGTVSVRCAHLLEQRFQLAVLPVQN